MSVAHFGFGDSARSEVVRTRTLSRPYEIPRSVPAALRYYDSRVVPRYREHAVKVTWEAVRGRWV